MLDSITVRRIPFEFDEQIDPIIVPGDPKQSFGMIAGSLVLRHLEPYLIRSPRAALDTEIEIRKENSGIATMTVTKQKDGDEGGVDMHRLESVQLAIDQDGDPIKTALLVPLESDEAAAVQIARRCGKKSRIGMEAVTACIDLYSMGKKAQVPRKVLAESGYLEWVSEQGWDPVVIVWGATRDEVLTHLKRQ